MSRRPLGVLLSAAVAGAGILTLVSPSPATPPDSRQAQYAAAAAEFGVPESILLAVSYLESRWDFNAGTPSTGGGYGPMHLTDAAYVASLPGLEEPVGEDRRGDDSREELPGG
ncbi:MAG TPA: N-acetylmuramoyl-L-alanine amidase, partial [Micromonosporaceae bacterium]|nr:N-acetylmuramoyl-L-alanine amidase [Micromonosporaceae bacterium]